MVFPRFCWFHKFRGPLIRSLVSPSVIIFPVWLISVLKNSLAMGFSHFPLGLFKYNAIKFAYRNVCSILFVFVFFDKFSE